MHVRLERSWPLQRGLQAAWRPGSCHCYGAACGFAIGRTHSERGALSADYSEQGLRRLSGRRARLM
ncbi:hypothetical protein METH_23175 (plasmid) [Leisingera methylohalidivorans DSM 14336]|uniref:Uncharacterized protein n=1 Tax=Leisingera methylohalidivorans DSM 14336 TaxID=999552 RepID=V9W3M1_9RHOB|nr:hypothetical protein METH_23175 [Leisingera methylohalidivorans DSM 14336]